MSFARENQKKINRNSLVSLKIAAFFILSYFFPLQIRHTIMEVLILVPVDIWPSVYDSNVYSQSHTCYYIFN